MTQMREELLSIAKGLRALAKDVDWPKGSLRSTAAVVPSMPATAVSVALESISFDENAGESLPARFVTAPELAAHKDLTGLHEAIKDCVRCTLAKTRTKFVFGEGNTQARLMFVGEAPGRDEDLQGRPFVGRAGQLLTKIIEAMGYKREEVYIANVLKCRPPNNRPPEPEEIEKCWPHLTAQIRLIKPKVICALGSPAARTLLGTDLPIGALRGKFHDVDGIPVMPTYHPAYLLRNPADKGKVWEDMKKIRDFLKMSS